MNHNSSKSGDSRDKGDIDAMFYSYSKKYNARISLLLMCASKHYFFV